MSNTRFEKGHTPWNKGTKGIMKAWNKGVKGSIKSWLKGKKMDKKYREKLSIAHLGHKPSEETKKKMSLSHKGTKKPWGGKFKRTFGTRKKLSERFKGEKSSLWRGGVSNENHKIRQSFEYKLWRTAVFMRDDYTCKICGKRGVYIQADHIIPFALDKNKRLDVNNGRTLCLDCHKTTESYMNNKILQKCDLTALSYS